MVVGRATLLILWGLLFLILLSLIGLAIDWMFSSASSTPKDLVWLLCMMVLALCFRFVQKRIPKVFAEDVFRSEPRLTPMRAAIVVIFVLCWSGVLIWLFASFPLVFWQTSIVGAISFCFLLFVVNWFERRWSQDDSAN